MKSKSTLIGICLMLLAISCTKTNIEGFWAAHFPMPSDNYGYLFYNDNHFYYYEFDMTNPNSSTYAYFGDWKVIGSKIYIKPLVKDINEFNSSIRKFEDKTEKLNRDWVLIGDYNAMIKSHQVSNKYFTGIIPYTLDLYNVHTKKSYKYCHLYRDPHEWNGVDYKKTYKYYMDVINNK